MPCCERQEHSCCLENSVLDYDWTVTDIRRKAMPRWCPNCLAEYRETASVCADCRALLVDELPEAAVEGRRTGAWPYAIAPIPRRLMAWLIDFAGPTALLYAILRWMVYTGQAGVFPEKAEEIGDGILLAFLVLNYVGVTGLTGGSIGKLALGMRVVNYDGSKVTWPKTVGRFLLQLLTLWGTLLFLLPALPAFMNAGRQPLWDILCRTLVVRGGPQLLSDFADWTKCSTCGKPTLLRAAMCPHCRTRVSEPTGA